jgi:hypothetical protein
MKDLITTYNISFKHTQIKNYDSNKPWKYDKYGLYVLYWNYWKTFVQWLLFFIDVDMLQSVNLKSHVILCWW